MANIPVPTLDQITGRTVMEKMRTLAKSFIEFANEIKDNVYTEEQVRDYVTSVLLNYYTKEEVDEAIAAIDLSDFYTKLETDNLLGLKRDITDSYSKTETDNLLGLKRDITDSYSKSEIDTKENTINTLINTKQNIISVTEPVIKSDDNLSLDMNKVIVNNVMITDDYIIKNSSSKKIEFRLGNSYSKFIIDHLENGEQRTQIKAGGISFNPNNSEGLDIIELQAQQTSFGQLGSKTFRMCGFLIKSAYSKTDTSLNELLWAHTIPNDNRTIARFFIGDRNYESSTLYTIRGFDIPCKRSSSDGYIEIGEKQISSTNPSNKNYIFRIDTKNKKLLIINNNIESSVVITNDFPTGKNLTDTVTFQDLVDLGLIKAPTTP